MAGQGYVNEGTDSRWTTLWGIGPWLSQHLTFKSDWDPVSVYLLLPLGIGMNIPVGPGKLLHIRLMIYRYDRNYKGYLFFSGAAKVSDHPIFY